MEYVTGILALAFTVLFAVSAWTRGKLSKVTSRLELIMNALDAAVLLLIAHVMTPWATVSPSLWLFLVAVFAAGVAGASLKWPTLPLFRPDRSHRKSSTWAIIHLIVLTGLGMLILG